MKIKFYKYQGTGNDFIMIDDLNKDFEAENTALIAHLCDRKFGVGSDGILLLQGSKEVDFHVDFINPDGSRSFCGNGSRCAVKFAHDLGIIEDRCQFTAIDGLHEAVIKGHQVELLMSDVKHIDHIKDDFFLDTGSPHHIVFVNDVEKINVKEKGSEIRYNNHYKTVGVNVNFVERKNDLIYVRTYERGVENETLSCGTGVTAAALATINSGWISDEVSVHTRGGKLLVKSKKTEEGYTEIWLCGPATKVFEGEIVI